MFGFVVGTAMVAFAVWQLRDGRPPPLDRQLHGTVVEEVSRRSSQTGRRTLLYAPRVSYTHPMTGAAKILEPSGFGQRRFSVGEQLMLRHDPGSGEVRLVGTTAPWRLVVVGALGVLLFIAEIVG